MKVIERLEHGLHAALPDMKGFSLLKLMRAFAETGPGAEIVQQAAAQLPSVDRSSQLEYRA